MPAIIRRLDATNSRALLQLLEVGQKAAQTYEFYGSLDEGSEQDQVGTMYLAQIQQLHQLMQSEGIIEALRLLKNNIAAFDRIEANNKVIVNEYVEGIKELLANGSPL